MASQSADFDEKIETPDSVVETGDCRVSSIHAEASGQVEGEVDGLITSKFERAKNIPARVRVDSLVQRVGANLVIGSFLFLATALGMAETEIVPEKDKFAWRSLGAPIGMVQYWAVYNVPRQLNWHSTAIVEFKDGTLKYYEFPRPEYMSGIDAFVRCKERTFFYEHLGRQTYSKMLPSVARFIARANFDAANPPQAVTFIFNSAPIPLPGKAPWVYQDELPKHTFSQPFFTYHVTPEDLADCYGAQKR